MGVLLALKETPEGDLMYVPRWARHIFTLDQVRRALDKKGVLYRILKRPGGTAVLTRPIDGVEEFVFCSDEECDDWPDKMQFLLIARGEIPVPPKLSRKEATDLRIGYFTKEVAAYLNR